MRRPERGYEKGNLKRETESLLRTAQNNAIRTHYFKATLDNMPQNYKCRLRGNRDKTVNPLVSECRKLS